MRPATGGRINYGNKHPNNLIPGLFAAGRYATYMYTGTSPERGAVAVDRGSRGRRNELSGGGRGRDEREKSNNIYLSGFSVTAARSTAHR